MKMIELSKNALTVLERRYLTRDADGKLTETPEGMFRRVAKAVASADKAFDSDTDVNKTAEGFYNMMAQLRFMPNSPTLMNAGKALGQLSACFVLPVSDSMTDIFEAVKNAALIHRAGEARAFRFRG